MISSVHHLLTCLSRYFGECFYGAIWSWILSLLLFTLGYMQLHVHVHSKTNVSQNNRKFYANVWCSPMLDVQLMAQKQMKVYPSITAENIKQTIHPSQYTRSSKQFLSLWGRMTVKRQQKGRKGVITLLAQLNAAWRHYLLLQQTQF